MHLIVDHTFWIFKWLLSPYTVLIDVALQKKSFTTSAFESQMDVYTKLPFVVASKTKKSSS